MVLIVWTGIGYGSVLMLEFFGVGDLRTPDGSVAGAGVYVALLAVPAIVIGAALVALAAMALGAVVSPRVRAWWSSPEPTRITVAHTARHTSPPSGDTSLHASRGSTSRGIGGEDGGDGDDDGDDDRASGGRLDGAVQEFDVCPSCGSLVEVLRGRLECLHCGDRFD